LRPIAAHNAAAHRFVPPPATHSPIAAQTVFYDAIKSPQWLGTNKRGATSNTGIAAISERFGRSSSAKHPRSLATNPPSPACSQHFDSHVILDLLQCNDSRHAGQEFQSEFKNEFQNDHTSVKRSSHLFISKRKPQISKRKPQTEAGRIQA